MRSTAFNTRTVLSDGDAIGDILPPTPADALSAPSVEDLLHGGLSLWPRGAAWGTPDGMAASPTSVLASFTRVLLGPFVDLYARVYRITEESRALTIVDSLSDWEADFGLPDACSTTDPTTAARRAALISRVRSTATITPRDFVRLAANEGFNVEIEEPVVFECGFSECGGQHTTGSRFQEAFWIVHVYRLSFDYFHVGEGELGADPLFEVGDAARLECLFADLHPAWSKPTFVYYDSLGNEDSISRWFTDDDPWRDDGLWID